MAEGESRDPGEVVAKQRAIQAEVARAEGEGGKAEPKAMQAGARRYPEPPFPAQHQAKPGEEAPRWNPDAPWMEFKPGNNHALAGSDEDRPGEWNQLDLICIQDRCLHIVNGKVVMALRNARYLEKDASGERWVPMTGGTLQIQSEAAEVFYRNIEIRSLPAMPPEYAKYF